MRACLLLPRTVGLAAQRVHGTGHPEEKEPNQVEVLRVQPGERGVLGEGQLLPVGRTVFPMAAAASCFVPKWPTNIWSVTTIACCEQLVAMAGTASASTTRVSFRTLPQSRRRPVGARSRICRVTSITARQHADEQATAAPVTAACK
jgi:hypothetical protein